VVTYATTTTLVAKTTTTITFECDDADESNAMVEYERPKKDVESRTWRCSQAVEALTSGRAACM
jgi:hypothetical protein